MSRWRAIDRLDQLASQLAELLGPSLGDPVAREGARARPADTGAARVGRQLAKPARGAAREAASLPSR